MRPLRCVIRDASGHQTIVRRNVSSTERSANTRARGQRIGPKRRDQQQTSALDGPVKEHEKNLSLEALVQGRLESYVAALKGVHPRDLYQLIMPQLERPLIRVAMGLAEGRQSVAANMLGIHRNTLRTRIQELGLDAEFEPKPRR